MLLLGLDIYYLKQKYNSTGFTEGYLKFMRLIDRSKKMYDEQPDLGFSI